MTYIPEEIIDDIRKQVNIVDLIGSYVPLQKKGSNYSCSCPFHEDRNPSFSVSESKQIFKCFSCGRGGNIFTFLQDIEGINFPESVLKAAEFANISIPDEFTQQVVISHQESHPDLLDIHQKVSEFYHYYLMNTQNGDPVLQYLKRRNYTQATIEAFNFGFAPENSQILYQYLNKEGFSNESLEESGIFYQNQAGDFVDRFRGRLIIPLQDERGRVIAFSGRILNKDKGVAKYLNSPETPIFTKGKFLFNIDKAKAAIRLKNIVIIAEGYMDVMTLYQHGFENVIATMGTSLTPDHLKEIQRHSHQLIFVFDGDRAGQEATYRAFQASQPLAKLQTKAIIIPNQLDPDEWLQSKGPESFQQLLNQSLSFYEFSKHFFKSQYNLEDEGDKAKYIEALITELAKIKSPIEQELRIQEIVKEFSLSVDIIKEAVSRIQNTQSQAPQSKSHTETKPTISNESKDNQQIESLAAYESERLILYYLMMDEKAWKYIENLSISPSFYHDIANNSFFILQKFYYDGRRLPLTRYLDTINDIQIKNFLSSIAWEIQEIEYSNQAMDDCFHKINVAFIQLKIKELRVKIKDYSRDHNQIKLQESLNEIMKLQRQIK